MPGRLVMELQNWKGPAESKKDSSHATALSQDLVAGDVQHPRLNMEDSATKPQNVTSRGYAPPGNGVLQNGVNGVNGANGTSGNETAQNEIPEPSNRLPPELEHFVDSYIPFGKLLERMAQQAYFDLSEAVDAMADMPVQQTSSANGIGSHGSIHSPPDSSAASVEKKLRLMNYAQTQKDRFIKALVLTDWSRNMDDVNKLIELTMWLRRQDEMTQSAADGIVRLKHNMIGAKMPNPNIEGALELLSTGKAPWMPDLGYLPLKALTPQKMLETLQEMNFALSVRLNLYEELPPNFQDYTIANGRATFIIPGEFEVDLAVADEEPESPFYFIDIRLLFSPASSFPDRGLRNQLENTVNGVLATEGLQGCYNFLHGFILTHKINVLKWQASEMARNKWSGCIESQLVHRSLIVQYWLDVPGGKNWIEIGIASGHDDNKGAIKATDVVPRISHRLFRQGQQVVDDRLEFDYNDLSMERMLEQIVAQQIKSRLSSLHGQLSVLAYDSSAFQQEQNASIHSVDRHLEMRLSPSTRKIKVMIEPVTGHFAISPKTSFSTDVAQRLDKSSSLSEVGKLASYLVCNFVQNDINKDGQRLGWVHVPIDTHNIANMKSFFQEEPIRLSAYRKEYWEREWAFAVTISLQGIRWWIVQLSNTAEVQAIVAASSVRSARKLSKIDPNTLLSIETQGVAQISLASLRRELRIARLSGCLERRGGDTICVNPQRLMPDTTSSDINSWCSGVLRLQHRGAIRTERGTSVVHVLRAVLSPDMAKKLIPLISRDEGSDMAFENVGTLCVTIKTQLGEPLLPRILQQLRNAERLCTFVRTIHSHHFSTTHVDPSRIEFQYWSDPPLSVNLAFSDNDVRLHFHTRASDNSNPHHRISHYLQEALNADSYATPQRSLRESFDRFCRLLTCTMPLLSTFATIEATPPYRGATVHPRSATAYKLRYRLESLEQDFVVILTNKDGVSRWFVDDSSKSQRRGEHLSAKLKEIWDGKGDDWEGLRTGALASFSGIADLILRVDAIVRSVKHEMPKVEEQVKSRAPGPEIVILD